MKKPLFQQRMKLVNKETGDYVKVLRVNYRDSIYILDFDGYTEKIPFEDAHSEYMIYKLNDLFNSL